MSRAALLSLVSVGVTLFAPACGSPPAAPDAEPAADQAMREGLRFLDQAPREPVPVDLPPLDLNLSEGGKPCSSVGECDDKLACTTDTCPPPGICRYAVNPNFCAIDGACQLVGQIHPTETCLRCDPQTSATDWSHYLCTTTFAGNGQAGLQNGPAGSARFRYPRGVAVTTGGDVYVADLSNHAIRLISGGVVSTAAGTGTMGFEDGPADASRFNYPEGIAVDSAGKVHIADSGNHRIRILDNATVTTLAGTGGSGYLDGRPELALFSFPYDVAVGASGEIYVADANNDRVRLIFNNQVTTYAGSSGGYQDGPVSTAKFYYPMGVAVDSSGTVYVADTYNYRIRIIANGQVSTLAGDGKRGFKDGPATSAQFFLPSGVAVGKSGRVYVGDWGNHRIRVIEGGQVTTLVGNGKAGMANSPSPDVSFNEPWGLEVDAKEDLFVADRFNHMIRRVSQ